MTYQPASKERDEAIAIANRLLDEPMADPDDDLRVLARQFMRALERVTAEPADEPHVIKQIEHALQDNPAGITREMADYIRGCIADYRHAQPSQAVVEESCGHCQGTGRTGTPGSSCPFCGGEGVRRRDAQPPGDGG